MVVRNKADNKYITSFNGLGCCSAQTDDDLKLGGVCGCRDALFARSWLRRTNVRTHTSGVATNFAW